MSSADILLARRVSFLQLSFLTNALFIFLLSVLFIISLFSYTYISCFSFSRSIFGYIIYACLILILRKITTKRGFHVNEHNVQIYTFSSFSIEKFTPDIILHKDFFNSPCWGIWEDFLVLGSHHVIIVGKNRNGKSWAASLFPRLHWSEACLN